MTSASRKSNVPCLHGVDSIPLHGATWSIISLLAQDFHSDSFPYYMLIGAHFTFIHLSHLLNSGCKLTRNISFDNYPYPIPFTCLDMCPLLFTGANSVGKLPHLCFDIVHTYLFFLCPLLNPDGKNISALILFTLLPLFCNNMCRISYTKFSG